MPSVELVSTAPVAKLQQMPGTTRPSPVMLSALKVQASPRRRCCLLGQSDSWAVCFGRGGPWRACLSDLRCRLRRPRRSREGGEGRWNLRSDILPAAEDGD